MSERTYGGHTLAQIKSNGFEEVGSDEFRDLIAAAEELAVLKDNPIPIAVTDQIVRQREEIDQLRAELDTEIAKVGKWCATSDKLRAELNVIKESRAAAVEQEQQSRVECNRLRGECSMSKRLFVEAQSKLEAVRAENERLRQSLNKIATMAEHYNYVGWQRIVGQMQKEAVESLAFGALEARRALEGSKQPTEYVPESEESST